MQLRTMAKLTCTCSKMPRVYVRRSVRNFVADFKKKDIPLHMLFNNAGEWIRQDDTYTKEGFQVSLIAMMRLNLSEQIIYFLGLL